MTDRCTDCHEPIEGEPLRLARGEVCKPCYKRWLDESKASYEREERETMPLPDKFTPAERERFEKPDVKVLNILDAARAAGGAASEPLCGHCGKVMTPQDSRLRPELFLHDECLYELHPELLPAEERPPTLARSSCAGRTTRAEDVKARPEAERDIAALIRTSEILQSLSADEQRRVLIWLRDRYAKEML